MYFSPSQRIVSSKCHRLKFTVVNRHNQQLNQIVTLDTNTTTNNGNPDQRRLQPPPPPDTNTIIITMKRH
eukprot:m.266498 g.266498  ORF g.266498 m.266498 type:complete len:70 (+) comp67709_c0_seq1:139-348(+)